MAIKTRLTFPRSGQVTYRDAPPVRRWVASVTGAGLAMFIAWGAATLSRRQGLPAETWAPLFEGLVVGVAYLYLGRRVALPRFYVLGLLSALFGMLASASSLGPRYGSALFFLALGAAGILGGAVTLVAYLWRTRPPGDAPAPQEA